MHRRPHVIVRRILGAMLLLVAACAWSAPAKRAVLIGINDYLAPGVADLRGPRNDVAGMRALLVSRYGFKEADVTVLLDQQATHAGIVAAIRSRLIQPTHTGDIAVLYYSGHGSQMRDADGGDESDEWDETIVPQDSRTDGVFDISDDELNTLLAELGTRTENVTLILDSCHSGTASRALAQPRATARDERQPPADAPGTRAGQADGPSDLRALGARFVLLGGSRAAELSYEDEFDGRSQGAFTYHLVRALSTSNERTTYRTLMNTVDGQVTARFPFQHPQIEGAGRDNRVFGAASVSQEPFVLVEPEGRGKVRVLAGFPYGISRNAELEIFAPDTESFANADVIATAKVTEVALDSSLASVPDAVTIPAHARARLQRVPIGGRRAKVWLDPTLSESLRNAIASAARDRPSLRFQDIMADADLRVVPQKDIAAVLGRDGSVLTASVALGQVNAGTAIEAQLSAWARWYSVLELSNPSPGVPLELELSSWGAPATAPGPTTVSDGSIVAIRIRNPSDLAMFFTVLDMSSSGRIDVLFPPPGAQDSIAAGATLERTIRMSVPAGRSEITDVIKLIAATTPVDGTVFNQAAPRAVDLTKTGFARLLADRAVAGARDASVEPLQDWTTAQASVRVLKASPLIRDPSFALHFDTAPTDTDLRARFTDTREVCDQGWELTDCLKTKPLTSDGRIVEVHAQGLNGTRSLGAKSVASIGQVFDDAYVLGERAHASYAEPLLVVQLPGAGPGDALGGSRGADDHDPLAQRDDRWSLRYAGVPAAWILLRAAGRQPGHEADGIVVAHPDTGYTHHPENWPSDTDHPLLPERGWDYEDDDADASDPQIDDGALANPGHGTASSSVIISPAGCQLAQTSPCTTGVAQGAKLIPLRVHTSVVVFSTKNLAKAIFDVSEGKRGTGIGLLSIAMGGPPSLTLWRAVRAAQDSGVLLIAAAGNYVQTVVWPARFDAAVAVAAFNAQCKPWFHSSHGRAVDISAPGESVWRATFTEDQAHTATVGMGKGTTFATGTTAGIAALWLAYHANEPALAKLKSDGRLTEAFRQLVAQTAWRPTSAATDRPESVSCPDAPAWRPKEYGPGLINAAALLAQPLPTLATRALEPQGGELLPLYSSLYPPATDSGRIKSDYLGLFSSRNFAAVKGFEGEVLYHYTMNEEVQAALDALVAGERDASAFSAIRQALRTQDLSSRLRAALAPG